MVTTRWRATVAIAAGVFGLAAGVSRAAANICPNFSFEQGPGGSSGFITLGTGSTAITNWRVTAGAVDLFYGFGFVGTRSVDLTANVNQAGTLETTLPTEVGVTYSITLSAEGTNTQNNAADRFKAFTISAVNAGDLAVLLPENMFTVDTAVNGNGVFADYGDVTFTATSSATFLRLRSLHTATFDGPTIDNVRVVAVPEAGGMWTGGGVMAVSMLRRRR